MNDEPIDLSALRTPPPLRDSDYAAIRARVLAKIRRRERRPWLISLPVAAAIAAIAVVTWVALPPAGPPRSVVVPAPRPEALEQSPTMNAAATEEAERPEIAAPAPAPPKRAPRSAAVAPASEPMLIHIQTADPEVRIIWIVVPQKEES